MSSSPALTSSSSKLATGLVCIVASVLLFSVYNALTKWLADGYSIWQIMFFRGVAALIPFLVYAALFAERSALVSAQPQVQLLRAGCALVFNLFFILAYREMPLAEAVAIRYAAPIFIVALSVPLLSERVGIQRASAAIVGFLGVLLIAQPGVGLFSMGALYALAGTLFYALMVVTTRRVGSSDGALCTVIYTSGLYTIVCALTLPVVWTTPGPGDLALLIGLGLIGSAAMLLFAVAFRHAPAALLAPFDYTAMLWAALFGYLIWSELPGPVAIVGMAVIAASGLFLMRHERLRRFQQEKP